MSKITGHVSPQRSSDPSVKCWSDVAWHSPGKHDVCACLKQEPFLRYPCRIGLSPCHISILLLSWAHAFVSPSDSHPTPSIVPLVRMPETESMVNKIIQLWNLIARPRKNEVYHIIPWVSVWLYQRRSSCTPVQYHRPKWFWQELCRSDQHDSWFLIAHLCSKFINQLLNEEVVIVGHSLTSCTSKLLPVHVPTNLIQEHLCDWAPQTVRKLVLIDTPGLDNTNMDNTHIIKLIHKWLEKLWVRKIDSSLPSCWHKISCRCKAGAIFAGVIYLHDISECRVTGAAKRIRELLDNIRVEGCQNIVLGTTKWSKVAKDESPTAEEREGLIAQSLRIDESSKVRHVEPDSASTWKLVEAVLCKPSEVRLAWIYSRQCSLCEPATEEFFSAAGLTW